MNTKEFKYFVLNTAESWKTGSSESLRLLPEGGLSLWPSKAVALPEGIENLIGLAVDARGLFYLLDAATCRIFTYSRATDTLTPIPCIGGCGAAPSMFKFSDGDEENKTYSGSLALGPDTLYVADTFNHRVQAIYRRNYQVRFVLGAVENGHPVSGTKPGEFNQPRDIVLDGKRNLYVLDYGNHRIQKFNRHGVYQTDIVPPEDTSVEKPENIALDKKGLLYVLDSGQKKVWKFDPEEKSLKPIIDLTTADRPFTPSGLAVDADKNIYVGKTGNSPDFQYFIWDGEGHFAGRFDNPHGPCQRIIADQQGNLFALCGAPGRLVLLNGESGFLERGVYYSKLFDSVRKDTVWHRLLLKKAHLPERTKVDIHFHVSDDPVSHEFVNEWTEVLSSPRNGLKGKDGLIMNAKGRYLRLKIEMYGDALHTPRINALQIYFPRLSYLRYLPATYQEDPVGRDFFERFLSLFESFSSGMEQQIAQLSRHFDAEATPEKFLNWLGSWLATTRDDAWSVEKRRALLKRAYSLYKRRGTLDGLSELIELFASTRPLIIEHFKTRRPVVLGADARVGLSTVVGQSFDKRLILEESSRIGSFVLNEEEDPPEIPFEADAFDFTILVDTSQLKDAEQEAALRRLIDDEKPAHTRCFIRTGRDAEGRNADMQLGAHTLVGIDTRLSSGHRPMRLGVESVIGRKTFVGTKYPEKGMVGTRSRVAIDTLLH